MLRPTPSTLTDTFSWDSFLPDPGAELMHLVICWSLDEPERVGEAALVEEPSILGRGAAHPNDPAPRLVFFRRRPHGLTPTAPLQGSRISRVQLEVTPLANGGLSVRSVGRCSMLVRDQVVEQAEIASGETIVLRNALVLLAIRRPALCERGSRADDPWVFPFGRSDPYGIIGESPAIWALRADLELAAESGQHVLLHGASGTGKELAARAIHALSPRRDQVFVARNAATVPEGLVDAELFGTAKGYPNAGSPERTGLLAEASGGTLFLDEIGELAPHLQAHLLRALDSGGEYQRLGDPSARRSDLRVVVATNRPLEHLKSDFAARFTFRVCVPGFEERREDIPLLLRHLLVRAAETTPSAQRIFERRAGALGEPRLDSLLVDALVRHNYSLHMRELQRLLWVAFASNSGNFLALTPELFTELRLVAPSGATPLPGPSEPRADAAALDRSAIEAALSRAKGNITAAARLLGLKNRYALYRLMKRHTIPHPSDDDDGDSGA